MLWWVGQTLRSFRQMPPRVRQTLNSLRQMLWRSGRGRLVRAKSADWQGNDAIPLELLRFQFCPKKKRCSKKYFSSEIGDYIVFLLVRLFQYIHNPGHSIPQRG